MRGPILRVGLLGMLSAAMIGCHAPAPTLPGNSEAPTSDMSALPTLRIPDAISANEMVAGEDQVLETQQRGRRPSVRWRRTIYRGVPYYVPYYYYYWAPRPYYRPYHSGAWWYYSRPSFGARRTRFRRVR